MVGEPPFYIIYFFGWWSGNHHFVLYVVFGWWCENHHFVFYSFFGWWCGRECHLENHHFVFHFLLLLPALLGQVGEILPFMSEETLIPGARPSQLAATTICAPGRKCLVLWLVNNLLVVPILPPRVHYLPLTGGGLALVLNLPLLGRPLVVKHAPKLAVEPTVITNFYKELAYPLDLKHSYYCIWPIESHYGGLLLGILHISGS